MLTSARGEEDRRRPRPRAPRPGLGGAGVPARPSGRLHLERPHLHHGEPDPRRPLRAAPHLDRPAGERAVLPARLHDLLDREAPLGARPVRVPPRQRPPPRARRAPPLEVPAPPRAARGLARRRRLRPPPRLRRVGRLGDRAQEHPLPRPDAPRRARVALLARSGRGARRGRDGEPGEEEEETGARRPGSPAPPARGALVGGARAPRPRSLREDDGERPPGRPPRRRLVAAGPDPVGRRPSPPAFLRGRRRPRLPHGLDREELRGREGRRVVPRVGGPARPRRAGDGLLRLQDRLARRPRLHLPAVDARRGLRRAVAPDGRLARRPRRGLRREPPGPQGAARRPAPLRRRPLSRHGLLQRLRDALLLGRGPLRLPGRGRRHGVRGLRRRGRARTVPPLLAPGGGRGRPRGPRRPRDPLPPPGRSLPKPGGALAPHDRGQSRVLHLPHELRERPPRGRPHGRGRRPPREVPPDQAGRRSGWPRRPGPRGRRNGRC